MTETEVLNKIEGHLLHGERPFELRQDAAALIIGLGGTGGVFTANTKQLFLKRYGPEALKNVKFLYLDTDSTDKDTISKVDFIPISGFDRNERILGWLNNTINEREKRGEFGSGLDGATIRMVGRWKLFSSEPTITARMKDILKDFSARVGGPGGIKKIYVIEIASICGGTGSSAFIDVPYFVRKVAIKDLNMNDDIFEYYGMLELPDSKIERTPNIDKTNSRARSYAALKELQYFMGPNAKYTARFSNLNEPWPYDRRVFTRVFLLSNITMDLGIRSKYNRGKNYLNGAIPEAINIMLSKPREDTDAGGKTTYYGFDSAMGVIKPLGFIQDNQTGKDLIVSTIGVSKIEIPLPEIILAVFNRLFLGLSARWDIISDRVLVDQIITREILPIIGVRGIFDYIMDVLEFDNITDETLSGKDFLAEMQNQINGLSFRPDILRRNADFRDRIEKKIGEIYTNYGPFLILKALEEGDEGYGVYIDRLLQEIENENPAVGGSIQQAINNYKEFKPGIFKKGEKERMFQELKEKLKAYFLRQGILSALKTLVDGRRQIIQKDFHNKYFERVNRMVIELTGMLKRITGVETTTQTVYDNNVEIFSWDFSQVPYEAVQGKIDNLFIKKITVKEGSNATPKEIYRRGKVMLMENGRVSKELFYYPEVKGKKPLTVKVDKDTFANVVSVEEMMQFYGQSVPERVSLEDHIKDFLEHVKNTETGNIFDMMLEDFSSIIELFANKSFKDLLIMSAPDWKFQDPPVEITETAKKKLFRQAIEKFKVFAMPSYPVVNNNIIDLTHDDRHRFSVTLEPGFEPEYLNEIKDVQAGIIGDNDYQRIPRNRISVMIAVNFYFDYSLSWYIELDDCRKAYEAAKAKDDGGAGLHLAEGEAEDWREKLEDIP